MIAQKNVVVVGGISDDPFAIDVAHYMGQRQEISDLIAYKRFANTEFCPRFISEEDGSMRLNRDGWDAGQLLEEQAELLLEREILE